MGKHDERLAAQAQQQAQREMVLYPVTLIENKLAVKIRETTGLDETLVLRRLGKDFTHTGSGALLYRNAMVGRSLVHIKQRRDGDNRPFEELEWVPFDRSKTEEFLNNLGSKAKNVLDAAYGAVNDLSEEEREQVKKEISPTIET